MARKTDTAIDYQKLFDALPGRYIAMLPNDPEFTIVAENAEHAKVAMVDPANTVGKSLFEVFPDTSETYKKTGKSELAESFRRVIKSGKPDAMATLRYDLKQPDGKVVPRYWRVTHYPLLDERGDVTLVYQNTEDITEEMLAGNQVKRLERQLDEALSIGSIGTWVWDIQRDIIIATKNLAQIFGVTIEQVTSGVPLSTLTKSIYEEDRERVSTAIDEAVSKKSKFEEEYRTVLPDGRVRWVLARGKVETDDSGKATSFPGALIDITERKVAEEAIRQNEAELRFLADSMAQLIWITRPDGYYEYFNQRWYEYTGATEKRSEGRGWSALFHPDDKKQARTQWHHSLKTGEPYEIEYRLWHAPTKQYRWVISRALPLRNDSGEIQKWYGTCTDIHDQKIISQNQSLLAATSKALGSTLDYHKTLQSVAKLMVPEMADWCSVEILEESGKLNQVAVAHKDPKKVKWAKEYRRHQGTPDLNAPAGLPQVLRSGEAEFYPIITDEMLAASAKSKEELKLARELGLCSAIIVPLKVHDKTIGALTLISAEQQRHYSQIDLEMAEELGLRASLAMTNATLYESAQNELTERRRLQDELREANETLEHRIKLRTRELEKSNNELQRSNRELEDFAYVASHDLQEPLRKIQAFSNLVESEYGGQLGEGKDYVRRMRNAANRMSVLIQDLLSFSRVTTKAQAFRSINLDTIASEAISDLQARIDETGGEVKFQDLGTIDADPVQMRQLLQNLIGNGLKFHKPDIPPVVTVSTEAKKSPSGKSETCILKVVDNGVGFDEKYLDRVFAVFQRLHGRDTYEGTGIGLAVCRKIAERHGGSITAKSTLGNGATFIVKLPRKHKRENRNDER